MRLGWGSKLFISNLGMKGPIVAVGEDQMQAVLLAFEGVLVTLQASGLNWREVEHGVALIGSQWNQAMAEGSRSRTYQEAFDAPSWV